MSAARKPKQTKQAQAGASVIKAPEVEALAQDLIERYHHSLHGAKIAWGFSTRPSARFGRVIKVPEAFRVLAERGTHFIVTVTRSRWDGLTNHAREAAVDELLCSMSFDGMTPRTEAPDFRGYRSNVLRYGATTAELEQAFRGCQLTLPGSDEIEAELAEPEPCDDCGEPSNGRQGEGGVSLCEDCWRFRKDITDPDFSNADDEGQHCEGDCGKFLRNSVLQTSGGSVLCWKCRESSDESAAANGEPSVQELDAEAASGRQPSGLLLFGRAPGDIGPDELEAMQGVDFTEHVAAVGAAQ